MKKNALTRYIYPCIYRGQQIKKYVFCSNKKDAAKIFGISEYILKTYAYSSYESHLDNDYFEGIKVAYSLEIKPQKVYSDD